MAYEVKPQRTQAEINKDFEQYKNEIFKGVWLVRYNTFSQYTVEQIRKFDRRVTNDSVKGWKTIDWMVEMIKKRENFDILNGNHIKLIYEIIMKYLSCIQELSMNNYSMNYRMTFPIEDMIALDELSVRCFNMISNVYGEQSAREAEEDFGFDGYGPLSKTQMGTDITQLIEDRKTVSKPDYMSFIIDRAVQ